MRFVKVAVKNFQGLESAEVEFGPGLNVVFGPNDFGKSTLASAIRAALLVPPSSSEAERYSSWFADAVPEVTLTFVDDDKRFWKVRKAFGEQASADLFYSKDGVKFDRDSGGREVEDKLRQLLAWGIPSPGGKGAPRKLPTSFLAQVLLAEQVAVETIFKQSTEDDGTSSGKDRLRKALAALAEEPLFKQVLDEVQEQVDNFFTPTGQRKRGRGSRFTIAEEITQLSAKRDVLKKAVVDSQTTQEHIRALQEELSQAQEAHAEAMIALEVIRKQWTRSQERGRAAQALAEAEGAIGVLDQKALEVSEREQAVRALEALALEAEDQVGVARASVESAENALRAAEEALRSATSEEGAKQREVARAKLGEERAELATKATKAQKRIEDLEGGLAVARALAEATKVRDAARAAEERTRALEEAAGQALAEEERDLELAHTVLIYGQWQEAQEAAKQASDVKAKADAARAEVMDKTRAAEEFAAQAHEKSTEAKTLASCLPEAALAQELEELSQRIAIAEAALGGGFSVTLRGSGKVPVHATADGEPSVAGTVVDGSIVIKANRTAVLRIGELIDLEIIAGAAEKRHELAKLRGEWTEVAQPILERACVSTVAELRARLSEASALIASAEKLQGYAERLRRESGAARQSVEMFEQRSAELLARSREAEVLKAKLVEHDMDPVHKLFAKFGAAWKEQAEELVLIKEKTRDGARSKLEEARRERDQSSFRAKDSETRAVEAEAEARRRRAALRLGGDVGDAALLTSALAVAKSELDGFASREAAIVSELTLLGQQASSAVAAAQSALESARTARENALQEQIRRTKALDEARSKFHTAGGEVAMLRLALERADRAGAEARLAEARREAARYVNDPLVSPEDVTVAERREASAKAARERIRGELQHAEGALTKVGGPAVEEELEREEEALTLAKERQRELEIDAESWKLLREALEAAEKEGSTHLGRSLAAPVSARFSELTEARYNAIRIDQHLKVETVDVTLVNVQNALEELSVGTRDQLATLLRLTIAEQLKSAVVLDDHLVHTDPERLAWFKSALRNAALSTQVIVISCRPQDYLAASELPSDAPMRDLAGGAVRAIDFARSSKRFATFGANAGMMRAFAGTSDSPDERRGSKAQRGAPSV